MRDYNRGAAEHFPQLEERVVVGTRLQDALDDGQPVFGFGAYLGSTVVVEGEPYGTFFRGHGPPVGALY